MGSPLNKEAYRKVIDEDIEAIMKYMPDSLERSHIITVLNWAFENRHHRL